MKKLEQYIFMSIGSSFFSIFATLFTITSIVYLVKIAAYTSIIKIDFFELFLLYSYMLPNILFYTVPISIFASISISFAKLSKEYELIVISSFGLNPLRFINIIAFAVFIVSLAIAIISIGLIPKTSYLSASMLNIKKNEANFNITASEFGQNFGKWMIFIENDSNKTFNNIKLFSRDSQNSSTFILADKANIFNNQGTLNLSLTDGKTYLISNDSLRQIDFSSLQLGDNMNSLDENVFTNIVNYWSSMQSNPKRAKDFAFYILVSIFPFISLILAISISYFNPRYQSNKTVLYIVTLILIYYILSFILTTKLQLTAIPIVVFIWVIISYIFYTYRLKNIY